jgi:general L-amino acid transport system substrate-binding protein
MNFTKINMHSSFYKTSISTIALLACTALSMSCSFTDKDSKVASSTLDIVTGRGVLLCGVSHSLPGFASIDGNGQWQGLDIDVCRAVAAAILGDADKVKFIPVTTKERFLTLQSGEIDLLARNSSWTLSRDVSLGIDFTAINYYDGQGFMVPNKAKIASTLQLNGATICMSLGTSTELNVADYFRAKGLSYTPLTFEKADEMVAAYEKGRCDAFTSDVSGLIARRSGFNQPDAHTILPTIISKEPLSPVVRQGDSQWRDVVTWTIFTMINAEEIGITSSNIEKATVSLRHHPIAMRLLGVEGNIGKKLGLKSDWAYQVIAQVGNYGESYQRNLGKDSVIKMDRGRNKLWNKGGLMFAPPVL